ncbi:glycosyltransferase family 4 protein [Vibrio vulnificus]|uniref:glycosyltransferase family 4 protein n=1 Tax=Vibrio vulnificus TaxID=672 RepID=UPI003EDA2613
MSESIIIHINMASGFGGGEVQTLNLIKNAINYRHYVFSKKGKPFYSEVDKAGLSKVNFFEMLNIALKNKKVILHAHDGRGVHIARLVSALTGRKYIVTRRVDKKVKGSFSLSSYRKASAIVGISQKVLSNISDLNLNRFVIHDSFSHFPFSIEEEERIKRLPGDFLVAQVGSLIKLKNVEATIEVAKILVSQNPDIHFLIVGSGPEHQHLLESAKGLGNITFWGFTPNMASVFKQIDVLIHPSRSEGLGSSILEAYQFDIPVITSDAGGIPEIVVDGETGYIVPNADPQIMAQQLLHLYENRETLLQMKKKVSLYKTEFSVEKMAEQYEALYSRALER